MLFISGEVVLHGPGPLQADLPHETDAAAHLRGVDKGQQVQKNIFLIGVIAYPVFYSTNLGKTMIIRPYFLISTVFQIHPVRL